MVLYNIYTLCTIWWTRLQIMTQAEQYYVAICVFVTRRPNQGNWNLFVAFKLIMIMSNVL